MNIDSILGKLSKIEEAIREIRENLYAPDGIRITVIHREDISLVEYWDGKLKPVIVYLAEEKAEQITMEQYIFDTLGSIPISACDNRKVFFYSDIDPEALVSGSRMVIDIFRIEHNKITEETIKRIRARDDFNNYLSRIKKVSGNN